MKNFYQNHRVLFVLLCMITVLLVLLLLGFLFLHFWPAFGGTPSKKDKANYASRTEYYQDGKFLPYEEIHIMGDSAFTNDFLSTKKTKPQEKLPTVTPTWEKEPSKEDFTITWLGHSTLLIQIEGLNILVDPIFSEVASPVSFIGPKRFTDVPVSIDDLPVIDIVLITHDHYDHLDYETIRKLDKKVRQYVVPLGVEKHLERWKVKKEKITNMAWWEEITISDLVIGCTPAKHYSQRGLFDRNQTMVASYVLKGTKYQIYESGDTGFGNHFQEIYQKYGDFDLVLMDSGQYNSAWHDIHMTPEESVEASKILNAKVAMPIHWGSFALSIHPWDDPAEAFTTHAEREKLETVTPRIGETFSFEEYSNYQEKWWRDIS